MLNLRFNSSSYSFAERLENKSIMLDKLKSLFIVEDEDAKASKSKDNSKAKGKGETAPKSEKNPPLKATVKVDTSPVPKGEGKPSEKFVNRLLEAIEAANLEGFDYLEYKQSLQSIDDMNMDEATMFKSSLAMAKTMGGTPEKLISSAEHYLKVLGAEEKKFQNALVKQQERVVTGRQKSITQLETNIAAKEKQIQQITAEIAKNKEQLTKAKSSVDTDVAKIQATKVGFYAAYHIVVDQIKADVAKMQKHFS